MATDGLSKRHSSSCGYLSSHTAHIKNVWWGFQLRAKMTQYDSITDSWFGQKSSIVSHRCDRHHAGQTSLEPGEKTILLQSCCSPWSCCSSLYTCRCIYSQHELNIRLLKTSGQFTTPLLHYMLKRTKKKNRLPHHKMLCTFRICLFAQFKVQRAKGRRSGTRFLS